MSAWRQGLQLAAPDLVKIDAEGAEALIIPDLLSSGERPKVVVLETHGGDRLRDVRRAMGSAGYALVDECRGRRSTAILTYEFQRDAELTLEP